MELARGRTGQREDGEAEAGTALGLSRGQRPDSGPRMGGCPPARSVSQASPLTRTRGPLGRECESGLPELSWKPPSGHCGKPPGLGSRPALGKGRRAVLPATRSLSTALPCPPRPGPVPVPADPADAVVHSGPATGELPRRMFWGSHEVGAGRQGLLDARSRRRGQYPPPACGHQGAPGGPRTLLLLHEGPEDSRVCGLAGRRPGPSVVLGPAHWAPRRPCRAAALPQPPGGTGIAPQPLLPALSSLEAPRSEAALVPGGCGSHAWLGGCPSSQGQPGLPTPTPHRPHDPRAGELQGGYRPSGEACL